VLPCVKSCFNPKYKRTLNESKACTAKCKNVKSECPEQIKECSGLCKVNTKSLEDAARKNCSAHCYEQSSDDCTKPKSLGSDMSCLADLATALDSQESYSKVAKCGGNFRDLVGKGLNMAMQLGCQMAGEKLAARFVSKAVAKTVEETTEEAVEESAEQAGEEVADKAAEEAGEEAAEGAGEESAEEAGEKSAEEAGEQAAEEAGEQAAEEAAEKAAQEAAEKAAEEAAQKAAEEAAEKAAEEAGEKAAEEAAEKAAEEAAMGAI